MKINSKELFSIPNILSYIRILLIPFFLKTYIYAAAPKDYYVASFIILLSGLTDLVDGYIARKYNMITELGKAIDPIADKLTQGAIVLCLMIRLKGMFVPLVVIFILKELFMAISCLVLLRKRKKLDGAKWFGKVSTAVFYINMFIIIAIPGLNTTAVNILICISAFFMLLSFALYIPAFKNLYKS
ncbi:CDP-alcohol phosphatidyltransferase family protein [Clostridium polynesiense]|uniref:CDP-alcohol phosphatidyltransferase family protein n=1 Tax=Clostridium polynesiense TaxID=1325933 RepID=UPI0005902B00|nr:CDP-alcohol phosphatidyltransferase family protein [Clostridium polynesiense]